MVKYKLKNGKTLKRATEELDLEKILEALALCWKEIHEKFPEEYDNTDLENNDLAMEDVVNNIRNLVNDLNYYCKISNIYVDTMEGAKND